MHIVKIIQATKIYKGNMVLNNISLSFERGKIYGLVGRNGSGKTLLLKAICGFIQLTSGEVFVNDCQIGKEIDVPNDVGIIIEAPGFLPNYSALQNLKFLSNIKKKISADSIKEAIQLVGLEPDSKKHVGKFSLGMRQRLGIAQAIMEGPSLLILDEPFNGLDITGVQDMRKLFFSLKDDGKTIIMASHSGEDIELLCDSVTRIDNGSVVI